MLVCAAVLKHRCSSHHGSNVDNKEVEMKDRVSFSTGGDDEHVLLNISCTNDHKFSPQNISNITLAIISLPPRHSSSSSSTVRGDADMDILIKSPFIMNDGNTIKWAIIITTVYEKRTLLLGIAYHPQLSIPWSRTIDSNCKPSCLEKCKNTDTFLDGASDNEDDNNDNELEMDDGR